MILTLPSSSSEKYYPNNTLTEFRTHLVEPLNFEIPHEVALSEITFPTQWECLPKHQQIVIVALRSEYSLTEVTMQQAWLQKPASEPTPQPITDVNWARVHIEKFAYKANEFDGGRSALDAHGSTIQYTDSNFWSFVKRQEVLRNLDNFTNTHEFNFYNMIKNICIPVNQKMMQWNKYLLDYPLIFKNNNAIVDYLNDLIASEVKGGQTFLQNTYIDSKKIFTFKKGCDMVEITPPRHCAISLTPELAKLLGFADQYMFYWKTKSTLAMDVFGDIYSIYVYCDLIESRPVADQMAQLLRVVAIDRSGRSGFMQTVSFQHLNFFAMRANAINTVAVYLKDRAGRYIPFQRGEVTVSVLLRPKEV